MEVEKEREMDKIKAGLSSITIGDVAVSIDRNYI